MISKIKDFFSPPQFSGYEESQRGKFIYVSLLVIAIASIMLGVLHMSGETNLDIFLFMLSGFCLMCIPVVKRGYYKFAAYFIAILALVLLTFSLIDGVGLKDAALIAYPVFIIYISFLFSKRASIIATIASLGSVILVYYLDQKGYLKTAEFSNLAQLRAIVILFAAVGIIQWAIMDSWEKMIRAIKIEIEERKSVEKEIRQLNRELEDRVMERTQELETANIELEAFNYSVSHDLRAPLRTLNGYSQALLEDYGNIIEGDGIHYLQRMHVVTKNMGNLIEDLLAFSRISKFEMERQTVDLSKIAEEILSKLKSEESDREVAIDVKPGVTCYADTRLLQIILDNLLGNAWKFTGMVDQARIEFDCKEINGQRTYLVRDNGAGFDMKYADSLFTPFQRLHSDQEFEGTGIGLATARRIVKRHGGQVWAKSKQNEGATFFFTLGEQPPNPA